MRKEDRVRMPPPLVLDLPPGFFIKPHPGGYSVFYRFQIKGGHLDNLVCAADLGEVPGMPAWITAQVQAAWQKLNSPAGWRGIHLIGEK